MARLPVVGGDKDVWGDILEEWLRVHGNEDGTLKTSAIEAARTASLLHYEILGSDQSVVDITPLSLAGLAYIKVIFNMRVTPSSPQNYLHTYVRFNNDSTAGNYGWAVNNTDWPTTGVMSAPSVETKILTGHAPGTDAVETNAWGSHELTIYLPGNTNNSKNVGIRNQIITDFTNYGDLNPLEMNGGGFWKGPAAITRIQILPESGQFKAGSQIIIEPGPKFG